MDNWKRQYDTVDPSDSSQLQNSKHAVLGGHDSQSTCMIVAITTSKDIAGTRIKETVLDKGNADHDTPKIAPTSLPTSSGMGDSSDIKQSLKEILDKLSKLDDITEHGWKP